MSYPCVLSMQDKDPTFFDIISDPEKFEDQVKGNIAQILVPPLKGDQITLHTFFKDMKILITDGRVCFF